MQGLRPHKVKVLPGRACLHSEVGGSLRWSHKPWELGSHACFPLPQPLPGEGAGILLPTAPRQGRHDSGEPPLAA